MTKFSALIIAIFISITAFSQTFTGHSGVYFLGSADIPLSTTVYANPNISGVVCRFKWETLETSPGVFNWSFIDGEVLKATNAGKKVSLQPLGAPQWIATTLGAQQYFYIDNNTYHTTYGQVVSDIVPFDDIYINRVKNLILQLSIKYANNPTVSYINTVGGQISRGMPETVITDTTTMTTAPFWSTYGYNADTVASKMNLVTDYYMSLFPNTPLWCSVDYVLFENAASNRPRNYLASLYTNYGVTNYPSRFGLWREDISGCTTLTPPSGSQWAIMLNNSCRTGGQMLWNVQDGPTRMNQCGTIAPNTKQAVLDAAVNRGIDYGMRYIEIYGADIQDATLIPNIVTANTNLIKKGNLCNGILGVNEPLKSEIEIYPNPVSEFLMIDIKENSKIKIYNLLGTLILEKQITSSENKIDLSNIQNGMYLINIDTHSKLKTMKIIVKH